MKSGEQSPKMPCAVVRENIDLYLSSELPESTTQAIGAHLGECPECAELIEARSRVRRRLREAVLGQELPSGMRERVLETIRTTPPPRRQIIPLWSSSRLAWGMAACLVIAVGLASLLRNHDGGTIASASNLNQAQAHVVKVLDIGFANHVKCTLEHEYEGLRYDDTMIVNRLGQEYADLLPYVRDHIEGFTVTVGHRCSVNGHPFIHMVLHRGKDFLSLAITPRGTETLAGDTAAAAGNADGVRLYIQEMNHGRPYEISAFETPHYFVYLTSSVSRDETLRVVAALAPGMQKVLKG